MVVRFVSRSTLYGGTLVENAEKDIMVGFIDAEGSGGLTSEDYDVKLIAGPMLLARSIIFNVAEGLHVSVSFDFAFLLTCSVLSTPRFRVSVISRKHRAERIDPVVVIWALAHSAFCLSGCAGARDIAEARSHDQGC